MLERAGATPKRRFGKACRSARGPRAGQSGDGVFREAGRAYCLLGQKAGADHTGITRSKVAGALFARGRQERESTGVIGAERNAKAERWTEAVLVSSYERLKAGKPSRGSL